MGLEAATAAIVNAVLEDEEAEKWIGVDLDGTLAKYTKWKGASQIGEPIPKMVARIRRWVGHGEKVKVFTARADDEKSVNAIKKWLKAHKLPDLEVTNVKDHHMKELWDDRAVAVEKNTGEIKEAFEPNQKQIAWAQAMVDHANDGAIWGVPDTGQVYQFNKAAKTLTLISGPVNDPYHYHDSTKITFAKIGWRVLDGPENPDEITVTEAIVRQALLLAESPEIKTLKAHQMKLDPEEREAAMKAKATWNFGKDGAASPAIRKSVVKGKTWFWSATHRVYQADSTLKAAINSFHKIVEPSA